MAEFEAYLVEEGLQRHLQALRQIPEDLIIPSRLGVGRRSNGKDRQAHHPGKSAHGSPESAVQGNHITGLITVTSGEMTAEK